MCMKKLGVITTFLLLLALRAAAQTQAGSVTGQVRDQQNAAVPGVEVALRGPDATFRFTTERDGSFRFLSLEPGTYTITATFDGFRPGVRQVVVALGRNVDAAIELRV